MHHRYGGVAAFALLHEEQRERLPHNHAAAENDHMRPGDVDLAFEEQTLHAERRAWDKAGRIAKRELGHVHRMESIHILARVERAHDDRFIDLFRRWRLHENSVHSW